MPAVPTLTEVKARLFTGTVGTQYDAELQDMLNTAIESVQDMLGHPLLVTSVSETFASGYDALFVHPSAADVVITGGLYGETIYVPEIWAYDNGFITPAGWPPFPGTVTVTYNVGWAADALPSRVRQAIFRHTRWQWSREHGGSESYLPGGDDSVVGIGPDGILRELRMLLGDLVRETRGPVIA